MYFELTDQPVFRMNIMGQEDPMGETTVHQCLDTLDPLGITWHVYLTSILEESNYIRRESEQFLNQHTKGPVCAV